MGPWVMVAAGSRTSVPGRKWRGIVGTTEVSRESPRQSVKPNGGVAGLRLLSKPELIATIAVHRPSSVLVR